jgi:hypothetical protein
MKQKMEAIHLQKRRCIMYTITLLLSCFLLFGAQDKKREPAWDPAVGLIYDLGDDAWVFYPYTPPECEWVIFRVGYKYEGKEIFERWLLLDPGDPPSITISPSDRSGKLSAAGTGKKILLFATMTSIQFDGTEIKRHFILRTKSP